MIPEAKYCDPVKDPSPIPEATFREENNRFEYSSPANWIETQTPIPSNGVKVPYVPDGWPPSLRRQHGRLTL
jgi:hypothetical protein